MTRPGSSWEFTTIHSRKSPCVWGMELMDAIVQRLYPYNKRIVEPKGHIDIEDSKDEDKRIVVIQQRGTKPTLPQGVVASR